MGQIKFLLQIQLKLIEMSHGHAAAGLIHSLESKYLESADWC